MELFRLTLIAGFLVAGLAGCTSSDPSSEVGSTSTQPPAPSSSAPSTTPTTFEGKFQSQAAATSGSVTVRVTDTSAVLQLKDISTGQGDDLRLMLSPGTLSPNASGELGLTSQDLIELGQLDATGSQRVEMDIRQWSSLPSPVRSVVIYNYADRTAYGTANLTGQQVIPGDG
ncbi:DM13 domain-containing protein [Arthrobacter sp. R1-13]